MRASDSGNSCSKTRSRGRRLRAVLSQTEGSATPRSVGRRTYEKTAVAPQSATLHGQRGNLPRPKAVGCIAELDCVFRRCAVTPIANWLSEIGKSLQLTWWGRRLLFCEENFLRR
jgi:hypothetical protein